MASLLVDLSSIVGKERVTNGAIERKLYSHDIAPIPSQALMLFKTLPDVVVRPRGAGEIAEIVKYARSRKIPITPRGAASWGFGGCVPVRGGIVLDLTGMNRIVRIDKEGMTVTVEAGITWKNLLDELEKENLTLWSYPTSAFSGTVGGWISLGGLGIGSLKYGPVKDHVIEIEVVTPVGEVIRVSREKPDELGYELDWFLGSEGTLGVITEVTLSVYPKPEVVSPHAVCFDNLESMCKAFSKLVETSPKQYFIKFIDKEYLDIKKSLDLFAPDASAYAMFVFEGSERTVKKDEALFREIIAEAGGRELDQEKAREEWDERFYLMRIKRAGPTLLAADIVVPLASLNEMLERLLRLKMKNKLRMGIEGFIVSQESVVLMPMYLVDEREGLKYLSMMPVMDDIIKMALDVGGRPFGGFGVWGSFYLRDVYDSSEVDEMKERKKTLDPDNIMNPGKIFDVKTRFWFPFNATIYGVLMSLLKILRIFG